MCKAREYGFVLTVKHIVFAVLVEPALVVFIQAFESVFDAGEVRNAPVHCFKHLKHRKIGSVECRNVIVVEWQGRGGCGYGLTIFHEFLDSSDFRERRGHCTYSPGSDFLCVPSKFHTLPEAAASHVDNDFEAWRDRCNPSPCQFHTFLCSKHISLSGRTVDEYAFQPVLHEHGGVSGDY